MKAAASKSLCCISGGPLSGWEEQVKSSAILELWPANILKKKMSKTAEQHWCNIPHALLVIPLLKLDLPDDCTSIKL